MQQECPGASRYGTRGQHARSAGFGARPAGSRRGARAGSAVGADRKVTTATTTFTPKDTIYASVATTGTGTATIEAKWTYQGSQTVKDDSKTIAPTGPASTAFSISKPDGWPAGNYKVDISLNGTQVASKDFSVQ